MERGLLAVRLRAARVGMGLSCIEVDRRAGLAAGHTRLIEAGLRRGLAATTVARLAAVLGVAWAHLAQDEPCLVDVLDGTSRARARAIDLMDALALMRGIDGPCRALRCSDGVVLAERRGQ